EEQPGLPVELDEASPGPAPEGEDERGRGDAEPGDPEDVDSGEQEHGERRTQVMKDRAADEEALSWRPVDDVSEPGPSGCKQSRHVGDMFGGCVANWKGKEKESQALWLRNQGIPDS